MDMLALISSILASLNIPIVAGWYDANIGQTHITFLEFDNEEDDFSDDEAETEVHYIQFDIWTLDVDEAQSLKKQVKKLLKQNGFVFQNGVDQFESDTKLWHIAQRFIYLESLE